MSKFQELFLNRENQKNLIAYIVFLFIAITGIVYGNFIIADYTSLRIWRLSNILIMLTGIPFVLFQSWAGIPDFLDRKICHRERYFYPIIAGMIFGILDLVVIRFILHPEAYNEMPPFIQPFPYSVFLYFSGAFEVEVFYRLVPLTIILLIGKIVQKGRYLNVFFIAGAILTSLREPLEQMPSGPGWFTVYSLSSGFIMNLMQALFFRKSGFISSLSVRLGHYLIWHILHGIYIQFIELP